MCSRRRHNFSIIENMKIKSNYLLLLLLFLIMAMGCAKPSTGTPPAAAQALSGNFTGQFTLIHQNPKTLATDTSNAVITLDLNFPNFSVGGDTTVIQYPSHGTYTDNGDGTITFTDATVGKNTNINIPRKHLNGTFLYQYMAPNLQIYGCSDTLCYNYSLIIF